MFKENVSFVDRYWQGVTTTLHLQDNEVIVQKTYDAQPIIEQAAEMRAVRRGQRWGEGFVHVGFIPLAEMGKMILDGSFRDPKAVEGFLKKNPKFVTKDEFLK